MQVGGGGDAARSVQRHKLRVRKGDRSGDRVLLLRLEGVKRNPKYRVAVEGYACLAIKRRMTMKGKDGRRRGE